MHFLVLAAALTTTAAERRKCLDSYYAIGNNIPTPTSRYKDDRLLINTHGNEIVSVAMLEARGVHGPIGFTYRTGEGTAYASGRRYPTAAQKTALEHFYATFLPGGEARAARQAQYVMLVRLPRSLQMAARGLLAVPCEGGP